MTSGHWRNGQKIQMIFKSIYRQIFEIQNDGHVWNALDNKSFLEKGVVIAGVPAKIVKYNNKGDKNE